MAQPVGFFTDTTLCIGCKACEVACKEWNQLPNTENAVLPSRNNMRSYLGSLVTAALGIIGAVFAFRERGGKE